jgi:hypothetical protein
MYSQIHTDFTSMNSKNSSFQNVIYLRFTLVFSVYARASGIIAGYIGIHPYPSDGVAGIIRTNCSIAPGTCHTGKNTTFRHSWRDLHRDVAILRG